MRKIKTNIAVKNRKQAFLVYSDGKGNIFEDTSLFVAGRSAYSHEPLYLDEMIELPAGSDLFELPGRKALGFDKQGNKKICNKGIAVAAFIAPAHTQFHLASYRTLDKAPVLPLYAYTAVGWYNNRFYVSATRIDNDKRQDCRNFNQQTIIRKAPGIKSKFKNNRLVTHLVDHCALTYLCPAARNFVMGRWECPIPTSPTCNANCIGCISFQSAKTSPISCSQHRISFVPTVEEIVQFAVYHLEHAQYPIVSFGQGCEGEPLLVWETIEEAIREIRKKTEKGIINLNTNASLPHAIEKLIAAGLDSIRISLNSVQQEYYEKYYRPKNYTFHDVVQSLQLAVEHKIWVSLNYFVMPGITDSIAEYEALVTLLKKHPANMIQWRNFNIDPEWFMQQMQYPKDMPAIEVKKEMTMLRNLFPRLAFGYFTPPKEVIKKWKQV